LLGQQGADGSVMLDSPGLEERMKHRDLNRYENCVIFKLKSEYRLSRFPHRGIPETPKKDEQDFSVLIAPRMGRLALHCNTSPSPSNSIRIGYSPSLRGQPCKSAAPARHVHSQSETIRSAL